MRTPLKKGMLLRIGGNECYEIRGLAGEGGGSLIYEADRLRRTALGFQRDGLRFALKECFPLSSEHLFVRGKNGEIIPEHDTERNRAYLRAVQQMQLQEGETTSAIYGTGFRLIPILNRAAQVELSEDSGATFHTVQNTVTVMESLSAKGKTLKVHLKEQRRLSLPQAFRIIEQVLYAVREVHQAGYLHLDIQDGNIFIKGSLSDQSDFATLLDFGSARKRLDDGKCAVIEDRTLFSTEGFSAPEMLLHNDGSLRLGTEADIYSIGCLLLLLLTGKKYSQHELAASQQNRYLTKMALRKIKCPKYLIDRLHKILGQMLAQDPMNRYHDADELLRDVSDFIQLLRPYRSDLASVEYDAFLCYRHGPVDSMVAKKMQQLLEHFRVPKAAARYNNCIKRVFLDEGELSSCADFGLPIREALKNAGWLIVICSPETPDSPWVNLEIDTFLEYHDRSRILAVLTGGEPEEAFPKQLRGAYPGDVGEVLAADARGNSRNAVLNRLKTDTVYRIAAPILGTTYDTLKQRRKRYVLRRAVAVAAACLLAAAGILSFTIHQRQLTYMERQNALVNESQYLAQQLENLLKSGARMEAVETALKALPNDEDDQTRPLVSEAVYALTEAVYAYQQETSDRFLAAGSLLANFENDTYVYEISPDGTELMIVDSHGQLCIYDLNQFSAKYISLPTDLDAGTDEKAFVSACYLSDGQIIVFSPSRAYCWDVASNQVLWSMDYADGKAADMEALEMCSGEMAALCEQQNYVAFCAGNDLLIADLSNGEIRHRIALPEDPFYFVAEHILSLSISEDGNQIAIALRDIEETGNHDQLYFVDLSEESVFACDSIHSTVLAVKLIDNDSALVISADHTYNDEEGDAAAIEMTGLQFHDGTVLWNQVYYAVYDVDDVTAKFCNIQEWKQTDSAAVTAILGHEVLQLDAKTGDIFGADVFDANILTIAADDRGCFYAALSDGSVWKSDMEGEDKSCLGTVDAKFRSAAFCPQKDMLLMFGENGSDVMVLSSRIGDGNFTALDLGNVLTVAYCESNNNKYRITVSKEAGETGYNSEHQTLRIWEAQTTNLLACTDSEGIKEPVGVIQAGSEDIYFYLQRDDLEQKVIGWNIQRGEQVFEYVFAADEDGYINVVEFIGIVEKKLYFYCDDTIIVIDGLTGKALNYPCPGLSINSAVVSSSGHWSALAGDLPEEDSDAYRESICLLNLDSGEYKTITELDSSEWIDLEGSLAFSPNECWLAVLANGKISIVNTEKGRVEQTTDISCKSSAASLFLSDQILVVCADFGSVVTWDLGKECVIGEDTVQYTYAEELVRETDQMFQVTVLDDDGETCIYLYTFEKDGKIHRYQKISQDAVSTACKEVFCLGDSGSAGFYPLYSLDDLIAKAGDILY